MNPFAFVSQVSSQSDSSIETTTSRIRLRVKLLELWDFKFLLSKGKMRSQKIQTIQTLQPLYLLKSFTICLFEGILLSIYCLLCSFDSVQEYPKGEMSEMVPKSCSGLRSWLKKFEKKLFILKTYLTKYF